ncbi:MAG: prenyltransferase [Xanthomonadales bacterium]|nr:prenyltransferase [Xanthomonadales bacterium]
MNKPPLTDPESVVNRGANPTFRDIWIRLLLYPTHSLPTALAPVLVGVGLALRNEVFAPVPALVGFLGSWLIHVAGVFADNHELLRKHPGLGEHPELERAVRQGTLRLSTLKLAIGGCLVLAVAAAPYLYRIGGAPVLAFGALGIALSLSYNAGPWAYVRRGLADPIFLLMFGVVGVVGSYYIQAAAASGSSGFRELFMSMPLAAYVLGLPVGAIVTTVMLIDDIRDCHFDEKKGWKTTAVRLGANFNRAEIAVLVALAYAAPLVFWVALDFDAWILLPLVSAPFAWLNVRGVQRTASRAELLPMTPRMAMLALTYAALLAVGVAWS